MPIKIGAKPESSYQDPMGLLSDCHRRVENYLAVLVKVGEQARDGVLTPELREGLTSALRYFREAAPKHLADEEESLFPRLRLVDDPGVRILLERVEILERDHRHAAPLHAELEHLGQAWISLGSIPPESARFFAQTAESLRDLYRAHIALEDEEVFPAAAALLTAVQQQAIGREMAARRG